ncbi:L-threonine aldolase [Peptoclostridium litorale DSM 5388]|uniref:Low specificity L-threonine aldolase LtaE n=1 Tax=Peptoclostridium litorale DSM 5388 TaxID=1121324 RepID=A0A069REL7_PEPLI|nr:aminotransferase class I/II-fold pyridoxal phosphate-dependent enzyme [Peptoclostridium litorale]KDR95486.1 Low specificity L-threonine aldolase LtaE [Peptoclostridium litorale DSM 5388]SIO17680.1 L-threonine aldolase [Peptoclostridium litorale DSM 5388]
MYSFKNDYSEGAHPRILNALMESNMVQEEGYGYDRHTQNAISKIKDMIGNQDIDVHLIAGGTQTNLTAIGAFLRPHEACVCVHTGHIAVHETGAIECTGHKVITVDSPDGKITTGKIQDVLNAHTDEHCVKPKLVYISNPTELGTIYTKSELECISEFCKSKGLILYADGARLGCAICAKESGVTLSDMCRLTDAFFIGATKNGALLGEALVIKNEVLKEDFRYHIKQRGALLAKGRLLGIQFEELFNDGLYFELASHANEMARLLEGGLKDAGCGFLVDSPTNQIFPILENNLIEKLEKKFRFYSWEKVDDNRSAIRLVTSWATPKDAVLEFIREIQS